MKLGNNLKQLRNKVGLTQDELAARCGLSKGFISQLERDLASPSIDTLAGLLDNLGTDLGDFFSAPRDNPVVFPKGTAFSKSDGTNGCSVSWLVSGAIKNRIEPIMLTLSPGGKSCTYMPFKGEAFGCVLAGTVVLHIGNESYGAQKGECFYYSANKEVHIENAARTESKVIWLSSPPSF